MKDSREIENTQAFSIKGSTDRELKTDRSLVLKGSRENKMTDRSLMSKAVRRSRKQTGR